MSKGECDQHSCFVIKFIDEKTKWLSSGKMILYNMLNLGGVETLVRGGNLRFPPSKAWFSRAAREMQHAKCSTLGWL